jgi:hypothetical protein
MKMKQFRAILAVATVAISTIASLLPAQAIPLDGVLASAGKSFVTGFGLPAQRVVVSQAAPQQNDYSELSSPTIRKVIQRIATGRALEQNCVKANGADIRAIDDSESMVSVGRAAVKVYGKVVIYTGEPYGETCSIQVHPSSEKVALAFAIPDNSTLYNVRVSIYVDGQERINRIMSRGQARKYIIDVTGANSYAYTLEPLDRINGDIYFPHVSQPR